MFDRVDAFPGSVELIDDAMRFDVGDEDVAVGLIDGQQASSRFGEGAFGACRRTRAVHFGNWAPAQWSEDKSFVVSRVESVDVVVASVDVDPVIAGAANPFTDG